MTPQTIRIAGHRGHSVGAPENTLSAFRKAYELGGTGVTCETDLAITSDGELILMHDETVDRTTNGHGLVQDLSYAEIMKLDAGSWFAQEYVGESVPRLKDALQLARELGIIYQLKIPIYNRNDEIFQKLKVLISELGCADLLQFSSFDFAQLREIKKIIPDVPTVGISHSRLIDPAYIAKEANLDALSIEFYHFPSGEALQLHNAGFAVVLGVPCPRYFESRDERLRSQFIQWVREGQMDQIQSDDVAFMARVFQEARS